MSRIIYVRLVVQKRVLQRVINKNYFPMTFCVRAGIVYFVQTYGSFLKITGYRLITKMKEYVYGQTKRDAS